MSALFYVHSLIYFQYDFLEKQLTERTSEKPKSSGIFHHKHEKVRSPVIPEKTSASAESHIKEQMEELKQNMEVIDQGGFPNNFTSLCV